MVKQAEFAQMHRVAVKAEMEVERLQARLTEAERKLARIVAARDALSPRYRIPADLDIAINAARVTDSAEGDRAAELTRNTPVYLAVDYDALAARLAEALQMVDKLHGYARMRGHQRYYLDLLAIMGVLAGPADSASAPKGTAASAPTNGDIAAPAGAGSTEMSRSADSADVCEHKGAITRAVADDRFYCHTCDTVIRHNSLIAGSATRSQQRRIALQKGEPMPEFGTRPTSGDVQS